MGVKTSPAGVTFTAAGMQKAAAVGVDMTDLVAGAQMAMAEAITKLNFLVNDVLTLAGTEATNITTINNILAELL
jgi:hypothetical protein